MLHKSLALTLRVGSAHDFSDGFSDDFSDGLVAMDCNKQMLVRVWRLEVSIALVIIQKTTVKHT